MPALAATEVVPLLVGELVDGFAIVDRVVLFEHSLHVVASEDRSGPTELAAHF